MERIFSRISALRHNIYVRAFSGLAPYYVVNEYPKSGGTWLAQMLSDALSIPFRRNRRIRLEKAVTHGHFLSPLGLHNVVIMWRDPRDLLVSFYYHCYFINERNNALLVQMMKQRLPFDDYTDVRSNLPAFIRFLSTTPLSPRFTWPEFAKAWTGCNSVIHTSYEELRADTPGELARIVFALTGSELEQSSAHAIAEQHSFAQAKANAEKNATKEAEMSFVREGSIGGWQKHFTEEAVDAMSSQYPELMKRLGYEF